MSSRVREEEEGGFKACALTLGGFAARRCRIRPLAGKHQKHARGATLPQQKSVHRRRRRFKAATRAVATSKSGRDAVAAPRRHDQHPRPRAAALRRSPRATTKRRPIRRSTRPRAAAAPRGNASRRHKTCVGPAVGRRRRRPDPGICARRAVPRPPTRTARTSRTL